MLLSMNNHTLCFCVCRRRVHDGVLRLCREAMKFRTANWDWLGVLPLCHFLSGACHPFANLSLYPTRKDFTSRAEKYGYNGLSRNNLNGYILLSVLFLCLEIRKWYL